MKKTILFSLWASACFAFLSCSKDQVNDVVTDNGSITIRFTQSNAFTRSLFDNTAAAEPWERAVNSITLYFYDAAKLLVERNLTADEIAAGRVVFSLPRSFSGTGTIYAIANRSIEEDVSVENRIQAIIESDAGAYNGTIEEVSSKSVRNGGFLLSGFVSHNFTASVSNKTDIAIVLRRTVAKVHLKTVIAPLFYQRYPGKLKITSVQLKNAALQTFVFDNNGIYMGAMGYSHTQLPVFHDNDYYNLFYLFENPPLPAESCVTMAITGIWDRDGDFDTVTDQEEVIYYAPVAGTKDGEIKRNGCYFVTANITGLGGNAVDCTITVSDWESPVNESVEAGF